ncbi:MAG: DUF1858 domain-containing protein [Candidatus Margulisbacteria bacterium]|nr:DUF1858 domain-containing protein [Candidatus Margulisiibacteriota bacterium]
MLKKITQDMLINEVVQNFPEAIGVFLKYGLHCIGCQISKVESIQQGAAGHGIVGEDLNKMIKDINDLLKEKSSKKST